ncbi:MAG: hypothetical protein Q8J80_05385 [Gallionella sp.]|nr:hypothetical protein [Gallionella sp.]
MQKLSHHYFAAALGIALVSVVMLLLSGERHFPFVRVMFPDGSALVFVDAPWRDETRCRESEQKMIDALRSKCVDCRIEQGCPTQLDDASLQALKGLPIDRHVVQAGTLRVVVEAGAQSAEVCRTMAEQITREQKQTGHCIAPR